ncbi:MAG: hypothetical protein ACXVLT_02395 [Flavisolibacter sp.]
MKKIVLVTFVSLVFIACGGNKKSPPGDTTTQVKAMTAAPVDEREKRTEELKKAPQLTLEQMRVLMPKELDSAKERNYLASTQFGYGLASVEYPKGKGRSLKVTLYDCAGEMGYMNYFENYWDHLNVQNQTESEFTKTIDFEGGKAVETYKKDMNLTTLTFAIRDRLVIIVEGKNLTPAEVESAAKKLHEKIA